MNRGVWNLGSISLQIFLLLPPPTFEERVMAILLREDVSSTATSAVSMPTCFFNSCDALHASMIGVYSG